MDASSTLTIVIGTKGGNDIGGGGGGGQTSVRKEKPPCHVRARCRILSSFF